MSQPFPVLKNTSHNDAEDSDTDYDELVSVCGSNEYSEVEDDRDNTMFNRNSQPLEPSCNIQSNSKTMPIPMVKNSVALQPNPSFLTQEEDPSSSPSSSPSRQQPLERHLRSQLSRNSRSKRFAIAPAPLPPMPHSATSFHDDIDSPTTPTAPCFAEGDAFYSNRSFHSFDSYPNSSTENLAIRTQSVIVAKSHRPSSLNPNPRHLSYRHSSNNLSDAKNAADADAKKQTESRSSMVGKSKERMSRTSVSELTDPNYQSTRSRLKAAAALVTPVQIPETPFETRKSLMSPLSAGPVLMTPRSSSLANMAATPAPVAVPTTPTLATPPIVNPKLVKALKTRIRTALPGSMDATEKMRLRSRSMTSLIQVTGTSMDAGLEQSKTHMYRTSSSSPSFPATTCPPMFGDEMAKAQLVH
ncbi:hypothetical protein B0O80DRAFT_491289 [Mortierella sp. GBAus27b]|nr:hypothetical protein B0O80DRAFT_491863 [Mortierella sp. GBAus27b]KAI8346147.1 hypothetical protein B0O80DRAFT_491289 [Mortierella sp. GBAus27b]